MRWRGKGPDAADAFLSLLYPPRCLVCGSLDTSACLCERCIESIEPVPTPSCPLCGLAMSPGEVQPLLDTHSTFDTHRHAYSASKRQFDEKETRPFECAHCTERKPAFLRATALGAHAGVLRRSVHILKYRDRPQIARPLGNLLAQHARSKSAELQGLRFDAVVALPMHPSRRRARGYNQAERLAEALCADLGLPLARNLVRRSRSTRSQVGLTARQRAKNLEGAFTVVDPAKVDGKFLLLVDDVITTGSSLHECADALNEADAAGVYAITLAAD